MKPPTRRNGSDLLVTRSGGEVVVLDRAASTYHHLNPLTAFVWDRCDGTTDRSALIRAVSERFDTDEPAELVEDALNRLAAAGLLRRRAAESAPSDDSAGEPRATL